MKTYRIADGVAWVSREDLDPGPEPHAYIARVPDGPSLALEGSACVVWLAVEDGGTLAEIAQRTSELAGVPVDTVSDDVARLLVDLATAGVLTVESAGGTRP